jgi:hypothetical protein
MVKHIPLFKAIMLVLRAIVSNVQLADLVLTAPEGDPESPGTSSESEPQSVSTLMTKLKKQIEEYLHRTRYVLTYYTAVQWSLALFTKILNCN